MNSDDDRCLRATGTVAGGTTTPNKVTGRESLLSKLWRAHGNMIPSDARGEAPITDDFRQRRDRPSRWASVDAGSDRVVVVRTDAPVVEVGDQVSVRRRVR
jgi:hypothetical protein